MLRINVVLNTSQEQADLTQNLGVVAVRLTAGYTVRSMFVVPWAGLCWSVFQDFMEIHILTARPRSLPAVPSEHGIRFGGEVVEIVVSHYAAPLADSPRKVANCN